MTSFPYLLLGSCLLLASTSACSKKDEPALRTTASYLFDGNLHTCSVEANVHHPDPQYDVLTVIMRTTPQPAAGEQRLEIAYSKLASDPATAYRYQTSQYYDYSDTTGYVQRGFSVFNTSIQPTSGGGFSATFTAEQPAFVYPLAPNRHVPAHSVTSGTFTDVRP